MAILQFIEIIAGRVNDYKKNRIIRKEKTHKSESIRAVEEHSDLLNENKSGSYSSLPKYQDNLEVAENYEEFSDAVDAKNIELSEMDSEYRFSVSKNDKEVFISIIRIKETGEKIEINKKNITHDKYYAWIRHIEKGEGFFIDESE